MSNEDLIAEARRYAKYGYVPSLLRELADALAERDRQVAAVLGAAHVGNMVLR